MVRSPQVSLSLSARPLFAIAILSICIASCLFVGAPPVNAQTEETTVNFWENPVLIIFGYGFIGAIAPEIIRQYQLMQRGKEITIPPQFYIVSVVFAIVGGFIAIALDARTPQAALYNGISFPSILKTYAGDPIPAGVGNPKKHKITFRQYLGALSIKRSKKTLHNKQKKKR